MEKTVFMNSVCVLDAALLLDRVGPRGRSWFVDLTLSGRAGEDGILVDFGAARRIAKGTVDAALDHRLLVRQDAVSPIEAGRFLVSTPWDVAPGNGHFVLNSYRGSLAFFSRESLPQATTESFDIAIAKRIEDLLRAELPERVSRIQVKLRCPEAKLPIHYSYTHSLRYHCGNCQRFHGHANGIEIRRGMAVDSDAGEKVARTIDGSYFINGECLVERPEGPLFQPILAELKRREANISAQAFVQYRGSQGDVALSLPKSAVRVVQGESTVENIADFIKNEILRDPGVTVVAYEGLQKGAISS